MSGTWTLSVPRAMPAVSAPRVTWLLAGVFVLSGCLPDLGMWTVGPTPADGAMPADGAVPPPGDGGASLDECDPPVTCAGGCPLPWVLGAVQDIDNDRAAGCGGRVWRWSVTSQEEMCACSALDAGGALDDLPFAVGFVPPSTVVVGSSTQVQAIDADADRLLWAGELPGRVIDVVPVFNPAGQLRVAVATGTAVGERAINLDLYEPATGTRESRQTTSAIGIGPFASATVSPLDRRRIRVVKESGVFGLDFDPWTGETVDMPAHTPGGQSGYFLQTISAAYADGHHHTVWTGRRTDLAGRPSRIFRVSVVRDEGDHRLGVGDACETRPGGFDYDAACDFVHAVPDPTRFNGSIALCDAGDGERRLVRVRTARVCADVLEQRRAPLDQRLWRLGLAMESYWAP